MTRRGDIYMVAVPKGAGGEQHGDRPALVIQNDTGNEYASSTIVAFLTSRDRGYDFYVRASGDELRLPGTSYVMLDQIRTIAVERLGRYMGRLDQARMEEVDRALHLSLGIRYCPGLISL